MMGLDLYYFTVHRFNWFESR